jgi:hypothetical protein
VAKQKGRPDDKGPTGIFCAIVAGETQRRHSPAAMDAVSTKTSINLTCSAATKWWTLYAGRQEEES